MNIDLQRYVKACITRGEFYEQCNIKAGNKHSDIVYAVYTILKENGRLGELLGLLEHESPYVRLAAATHCLQFPDSNAETVLEELTKLTDEVGFTARSSLFAWRNGMVKF